MYLFPMYVSQKPAKTPCYEIKIKIRNFRIRSFVIEIFNYGHLVIRAFEIQTFEISFSLWCQLSFQRCMCPKYVSFLSGFGVKLEMKYCMEWITRSYQEQTPDLIKTNTLSTNIHKLHAAKGCCPPRIRLYLKNVLRNNFFRDYQRFPGNPVDYYKNRRLERSRLWFSWL